MIIKSMTRKGSPSFGQLLGYMNGSVSVDRPAILHNLKDPGGNLKQIESEFLKNFQHCPKRKNGVVLFHEVLSFSVLDKARVTPEIVEDLGREYLNLRAPNALGYAQAHFEKDSVHLHIMLSGNLIGSDKKLRLTKKEFAQVKQELERIQWERYPELSNSLVFESKEVKPQRKQSRSEQELGRRLQKDGKLTEKENAAQVLEVCLRRSVSDQEFKARLEKAGFEFYARGKTPGVKNTKTGRKHRLKTLGCLREYVQARERWEKLPVRTAEIKTIQRSHFIQQIKNLDFRKDILEVLESNRRPDPNEPPHIRKRRMELQRVARLQRDLRRSVQARAGRSR